jgi:hypothetical protein
MNALLVAPTNSAVLNPSIAIDINALNSDTPNAAISDDGSILLSIHLFNHVCIGMHNISDDINNQKYSDIVDSSI